MTPAQLLLATALQWRAQRRAAMVVQVQAHRGSVPRETGTRMLVAADEVVGTIGGGHLELLAIATAREQLQACIAHLPSGPLAGQQGQSGLAEAERNDSTSLVQRIALGPTLGQCCGGALELSFTPLLACEPAAWPVPGPLFTLQLYGAGHVGRAIVRLLAGINCQVQWIDERETEFSDVALPPHVQRVCVEPVQAEVAVAPPGAFYLVLTHSHELDLQLCRAILQRSDAGWFGLIGSRTKRARFEHRLAEQGIGAQALQRMVCPIGVPGIAGKEPEVMAIAVVAQLLQAASATGSGPGAR